MEVLGLWSELKRFMVYRSKNRHTIGPRGLGSWSESKRSVVYGSKNRCSVCYGGFGSL